MSAAELAAVIATGLAASSALPQIRRVVSTGDVAGVSMTTAALGVATELAWVVYGIEAGLWLVIPEAAFMATTCTVLVLALVRAGGRAGRAVVVAVCWGAVLVMATVVNPAVAAAALSAAYLVQVTPAVWTAYRTPVPSGLAAATWVITAVEAMLWGVYGIIVGDAACIGFGVIGTVASVAIFSRALLVARRRSLVPLRRGTLSSPSERWSWMLP